MISVQHLELLEARGFDAETLVRHGVDSLAKAGGEWISIPFVEHGKTVNHKYRTISGEKKFYQDGGSPQTFWNFDVLMDEGLSEHPLIITEGEFDAISAIQAGFLRVVSVPNGAPPAEERGDAKTLRYQYLERAQAYLRDVRNIIIASDDDDPGKNLLHDLSIKLGAARCKWIKYPKLCKDLGDALHRYGVRGVTETINRAAWMAVGGIYRMSELPPLPEVRAYDSGIIGLAKHYKLRPGDFTVITGTPNGGKTSFINDLCCRMVQKHGWPIAIGSFEQSPQKDHRRNLRTWFNEKRVIHQTFEEIKEADRWIDEWFTMIYPEEDDEVTLAWVLEKAAAAIIRRNVRLVVIDPWNEMDHDRPNDMTLTEYTGFAIKQFRKLARKYQVHVIVAAHPAKMKREGGSFPIPSLYDISDSSHWYNKSDVGIIVHRSGEDETMIRVQKSRYFDEIGEPGDYIATFDRSSNRYRPKIDLGPMRDDEE